MTHSMHAALAKVATPCTADTMTFGGRCLNCGWEEPREPAEEFEERECPTCGHPNLPAGQLGRLLHYNCRSCGIWYYHEVAR